MKKIKILLEKSIAKTLLSHRVLAALCISFLILFICAEIKDDNHYNIDKKPYNNAISGQKHYISNNHNFSNMSNASIDKKDNCKSFYNSINIRQGRIINKPHKTKHNEIKLKRKAYSHCNKKQNNNGHITRLYSHKILSDRHNNISKKSYNVMISGYKVSSHNNHNFSSILNGSIKDKSNCKTFYNSINTKRNQIIRKSYKTKHDLIKLNNKIYSTYHKKQDSHRYIIKPHPSKNLSDTYIKPELNKLMPKHKAINSIKKKRIRICMKFDYPIPGKKAILRKMKYKSNNITSERTEKITEITKNINNSQNYQDNEPAVKNITDKKSSENKEKYELAQNQTRSPVEIINERLQGRAVLAEVKPGYSCIKGDKLTINEKAPPKPERTEIMVDSNNDKQTVSIVNRIKKTIESPIYLTDKQYADNASTNTNNNLNIKNVSSTSFKQYRSYPKSNKQFKHNNTVCTHNNKSVIPITNRIDYSKVKTSIIMLNINNDLNYDLEVIIWPNKQISVPIKYLAGLMDIEAIQNHVTKSISFDQSSSQDRVTVDFQNKKIQIGSSVINNIEPKLIYIKNGFVVSDDIYVPLQIANELLDIKAKFSTSAYTMDLKTSKTLKAMVQLDNNSEALSNDVYSEPTQNILKSQTEHRLFNIRQFNYNLGSSLDRLTSDHNTNNNENANAGIMAMGSLLGGTYHIGTNSLYNNSSMVLDSYVVSLDYKNPNYELSLGKTNAILSQLTIPGASIWGIRAGTPGANTGTTEIPRYIYGRAEENSSVELYINDIFSERQQVENGEYSFDFFKYPHDYSIKIRVDQISQNGTRKTIYEHKFSLDRRLLAEGQKQFSIFSGVDDNGSNSRQKLFGSNFDDSLYEPVRYVNGTKFRMGIFKKLTMGINYADSMIIKNPDKFLLNNTNSMYIARAYRMGRTSSGSVTSMDMDYVPFKDLRLSAAGGISKAKSKLDPLCDPNGEDFGGLVSAEYNNNKFNINLSSFSYGPDYYTGTTSSTMDQRGVEINSRMNLGKATLNSYIRRYNSNLDNYFNGGIARIFDYSSSVSGSIDQNSSVTFGVRSFNAKNTLYSEGNTTFDITYKRKFGSNVDLILNNIHNILKQDENNNNANYENRNQFYNIELDYNAKNLGIFRFTNQNYIMDTGNNIFSEDENIGREFTLNLDRSRNSTKGFAISPVIGYRYQGDNKGIVTGFNATHTFRSGPQLVLSYMYNSVTSGIIGGNIALGGTRSHCFTINLVQSVDFGIKKVIDDKTGERISVNPDNSIIKGTVFADLNQNGIKDIDEKGIPGINVKSSYGIEVTTDKDGYYSFINLSEGTQKVEIDKENLPAIYNPVMAKAIVKVKMRKIYIANLGIIPCLGSVSGKVTMNKINSSNSEIIVQLLDMNGKEVKYTTTDSQGNYNIDSIPAGEYYVVVDKNYLDYIGMQDNDEKEHKIVIPPVYDDFVDIKNVNITLSPIQIIPKKFMLTTKSSL